MTNLYVDTDGVSQSYSTLQSAIATLGSLADDYTIYCAASTGVADTSHVDLTGITLNGYTLSIQPASGHEADPSTSLWDTSKYRLAVAYPETINLVVPCTLGRIQISDEGGVNSSESVVKVGAGAGAYYFDWPLIRQNHNDADTVYGVYVTGSSVVMHGGVCVYSAAGATYTAATGIYFESSGTTAYLAGTIDGFPTGINAAAATSGHVHLKNFRVTNATTSFTGTFAADSDYNLSEDGNAPDNGNSVPSATTVVYVSSTLQPDTGDDGIDAGVDLSGDSNYDVQPSTAMSADASGAAISGTWDIGALQAAVAGGSPSGSVVVTANHDKLN